MLVPPVQVLDCPRAAVLVIHAVFLPATVMKYVAPYSMTVVGMSLGNCAVVSNHWGIEEGAKVIMCCGIVAVAIRPQLFQAIMTVESNGDINAVGDGGLAIGPFQIHKVYWNDAADHDPSLRANGKTYQNCRGAGSIEYSKRVIQVLKDKVRKIVMGS